MSKTVEQIKAARNALYDALPIGEVGANAFDLIKLIKEHLCKLDEIVDTTPSPDVAGSDAGASVEQADKTDEDELRRLLELNRDTALTLQRMIDVLAGAAFQAAQGDATDWKAENANTLEWLVMFVSALKELVELKSIKDTVGKNEAYETRQPAAWKTARNILELWERDGNYGRPVNQPAPAAVSAGTWVKASDKPPSVFGSDELHYKLDGRKITDGFFINHGKQFQYYDGFGKDYKTLESDDFRRIEWLDESAPGIPADKLVEDAAIDVNNELLRLAKRFGLDDQQTDVLVENVHMAFQKHLNRERNLPADVRELVAAANDVIVSMFWQYKARNGKMVSVESGGEKCWIVPYDKMEILQAALAGIKGK